MRAGTAELDPVFEVTGVPAAEILHRCAALRAAHGWHSLAARPIRLSQNPDRTAWRLLDFADVADTDFVTTAHVVLLGRMPSEQEATRRIADLRARCSRLEIVVRLALSPEGRRAGRRPVRGIVLPALLVTGRGLESARRTRALGRAVRVMERTVHRALGGVPPSRVPSLDAEVTGSAGDR